MCRFMSALVLQDGTILEDSRSTDSHSMLVQKYKDQYPVLKDGREWQPAHAKFLKVEFARKWDAEFVEQLGNAWDVEAYHLALDEENAGGAIWWTEEMQKEVEHQMRRRLAAMVLDKKERGRTLVGGTWILGPGAVVSEVSGARIVEMAGEATWMDHCWVGRFTGRAPYLVMGSVVERLEGPGHIGMLDSSVVRRVAKGPDGARPTVTRGMGSVVHDPCGHMEWPDQAGRSGLLRSC